MSKRITIVGASGGQQPLLSDYLVAFYAFENNTEDSHIYGLDGVATNPFYATGVVGDAYNSQNSNTNRTINFGDDDKFSFTDGVADVPFTISTWINIEATSGLAQRVIVKYRNSAGAEWAVFIFGTIIAFRKCSLGVHTILHEIRGSSLTTNTWFHICYTSKGTGNINDDTLYVNGVDTSLTRQDTGYVRMQNGTLPMTIGSEAIFASTTKFRGKIDQTAIYNGGCATPQQVLALYNNGNGTTYNETLNI